MNTHSSQKLEGKVLNIEILRMIGEVNLRDLSKQIHIFSDTNN